jgi:hypothetical protein
MDGEDQGPDEKGTAQDVHDDLAAPRFGLGAPGTESAEDHAPGDIGQEQRDGENDERGEDLHRTASQEFAEGAHWFGQIRRLKPAARQDCLPHLQIFTRKRVHARGK